VAFSSWVEVEDADRFHRRRVVGGELGLEPVGVVGEASVAPRAVGGRLVGQALVAGDQPGDQPRHYLGGGQHAAAEVGDVGQLSGAVACDLAVEPPPLFGPADP